MKMGMKILCMTEKIIKDFCKFHLKSKKLPELIIFLEGRRIFNRFLYISNYNTCDKQDIEIAKQYFPLLLVSLFNEKGVAFNICHTQSV